MSRRNARPLTIKPKGLSDSIDGTNSFPGAMTQLVNLVPASSTNNVFVPRTAAQLATDFSGFSTPAGGTALLVIGARVYGMISSAHFAGKDEPFCYDIAADAFVTISGTTSANLPTTQSTTGDWQPPHMEMIANRIIVTHPGFPGASGPFFGWIDQRSFVSNTLTGNTHSGTKVIDNLSSSPILAGWQPGDHVTGTDIAANSFVVSMTTTTVTLSVNMTGSHSGVTLTDTSGTSAAPVWGAGNTNTNPLVAVPAWVSQFNGRAWYSVGNAQVFSDSLVPTQVTNATQVLTLGDSTPFICSAGLPLNNITTGGIIQSLIAVKAEVMWQITGDQATMNLADNELNVAVGSLAPNTFTPTPLGLAFIAPDGLRIIDFGAKVSDPLGANGAGVSVPFINALTPSRMVAAFNQNVLRISCQNSQAPSQPVQEFWLDFNLKVWSGPHTFPAQQIAAYPLGTPQNQGFVSFGYGVDAKLWLSGVNPLSSDIYIENSVQLNWAYQTVLEPDNQLMSQNRMGQSAIAMALPGGQNVSFSCVNEIGTVLNQLTIQATGTPPTTWGAFTWGGAPWGQATGYFRQYDIPWTAPIVFKQMSVLVVGQSAAGFAIGNLYLKYQPLGYLLNILGAA